MRFVFHRNGGVATPAEPGESLWITNDVHWSDASSPRSFGDDWLREARTPLLQVPSAIVPESLNLLFDPVHSAASGTRIVDTRPFTFDPRSWTPAAQR